VNQRASEHAYSFLRQRLASGYYGPGTQLKEEYVADELGISRTPVRVALRRLVDDGLLVAAANRGVFVAEWTDRDVKEVFDLRRLLEAHAAGLAAERATVEQVEAMRSANARMAEALKLRGTTYIAEIQAANNELHTLIIEASGSPRLRAFASQMVIAPMATGTFYVMSDEAIQRSINHHDDIIYGISIRNFDLASQAMSLHLTVSYENFSRTREQVKRERAA
jgi:DNA-binding GntR family transcriptional regulator